MSYTIGLVSYTFLFIMLVACGGHQRFLDRVIKGSTTLKSEWMDITPDPPLSPERDVQGIVLHVDKPFTGELEKEGTVRLADGTFINPEIQLVDMEGNTFNLELNGQFGNELILYSIPDQLKSKKFRTVRIRSDRPISCKEIFWRCYYVTDIN